MDRQFELRQLVHYGFMADWLPSGTVAACLADGSALSCALSCRAAPCHPHSLQRARARGGRRGVERQGVRAHAQAEPGRLGAAAMAAQRRAESHAWDEEEEAVRRFIVERLGAALAAKVSDTMMMRFVRGYYYEEPRAEKTAEILRETLEWRERMGVDRLIDAPDELLVRPPPRGRDPVGRGVRETARQ